MDINYIILAHQNPQQLKRLVQKLNEEWVRFYLHIDLNSRIEDFKLEIGEMDNLTFLEGELRQEGTWGDIGIVRATINAMKLIHHQRRKGYTILLSGQDYPLKNNLKILSFLKGKNNFGYMSLFPIPHPDWSAGGLNRIEKYKINKSKKRGHFLQLPSIYDSDFYDPKIFGHINYLWKFGQSGKIRLIFRKRRFPNYLQPYGGGQWWVLPFEMTDYILNFLEKHPDYLDYHINTLLPDEIFFHSILGSSHFIESINPSITYVNWERKTGPLPVTFREGDKQEIKNASNNHFFARKFDINIDEKILSWIDQKIITR